MHDTHSTREINSWYVAFTKARRHFITPYNVFILYEYHTKDTKKGSHQRDREVHDCSETQQHELDGPRSG